MFRHGEDFELVEDVATLDADALDTLLASSYGQQMFDGGETKGAIRGDYIAELASRSPKVYLATSGPNAEYAACAIVTECLAGSEVPYLCKFAVSEAAQGTGVADALWSRVKAEHADGLYWRSHAHSPINPWFFQVNIYIYPFVITERYDIVSPLTIIPSPPLSPSARKVHTVLMSTPPTSLQHHRGPSFGMEAVIFRTAPCRPGSRPRWREADPSTATPRSKQNVLCYNTVPRILIYV